MDPWLLELIIALLEFLLWLAELDLVTFDFDIDWGVIWRDITEALVNYVLNYLIGLVNAIITELVMMLLTELDKLCEEEIDYDGVDLSGLISDNFASPREAAAFFGSLAGNIGDGPTDAGPLLRQLIKDISAVLSTKEMCSLIQGKASTEVLTIVHNIILLDKYSPFHRKFQTLEDVSTFFHGFSKLIDPSFCELEKLTPDAFSDLCKSQFERSEEIRAALLSKKDGITSQQIEQQIEDEKQRRKDLLDEMMDLLSAKGGPGAALAEKFSQGLANSDIMERVSDHPATKDAINQMKSAVFDNTLTTLAAGGLGPLETPFTMVQYNKVLAGAKTIGTQAFSINRGIMHIISDEAVHNFYRYGLTSRRQQRTPEGLVGDIVIKNDKLGDGLVDHLGWINLNKATIPDASTPYSRTTITTAPYKWSYRTKIYPRVGGWSVTGFGGSRSFNRYDVSYDLESRTRAASRFDYPNLQLDSPTIKTFFIKRDPFVGIPVEATSENGVPLALARDPILKTYPIDFDLSPDREVLRLPHDTFLKKHNATPIDVFSDLPKVFADDLVPNYNEFLIKPEGSKQQATYMYFVTNRLQRFAALRRVDQLNVEDREDLAEEIVDSYQCVFNDVMRILYRFVTDSEFHHVGTIGTIPKTKHMLGELRKAFKDPEKLLELLGLTDDIEKTIQQNISSSLSKKTSSAEATASILGEPLLRYMIRMYILEIYLKNFYMFVSRPERRNSLGKKVVVSNQEARTLNVSNPLHPKRTLDLKDN